MKINDFVNEEKTRLDPKCWTGKKIGNPKTKVKGGVRVNNCVPAESVEEAANAAQQAAIAIAKKNESVAEAAPPGAKAERMVKHIKKGYAKDGKLSDKEKSIAYATAWKSHNKGVTEGYDPVESDYGQWEGILEKDGYRMADPSGAHALDLVAGNQRGPDGYISTIRNILTYVKQNRQVLGKAVADRTTVKDAIIDIKHKYPQYYQAAQRPQGMAEADISRRGFLKGMGAAAVAGAAGSAMAQSQPPMAGLPDVENVDLHKMIITLDGQEYPLIKLSATDIRPRGGRQVQIACAQMGERCLGHYNAILAGGRVFVLPKESRLFPESVDNGEYDDEAGMADNNLETLARAVDGIDDLIQSGDNLPEWCQEKIAVAKSMLVAVWDYMASEEASDEVDPEVDEMFEAMNQLAEQLAAKHRVSADTVWESFEALDDRMLYETAAWRRKEGKSKSGGLNAKGVASYRRENPGSKLQTAVTTKPSKLKAGSKAAKRRKSFCARMSGVKGPMKKPNGKPTRKALALRKWNC
jgi:hypothetical protein